MKSRLLTPRSKGFTLIEVLVVIAIIALLAGVSYSIYSHATETAARTRCTETCAALATGARNSWSRTAGNCPPAA